MFNRIPPIILVLLCLAAFGFLWRFIHSPIQTLLVIGMAALLFYFVNNFVKTGRFLPRSRNAQVKNGKPTVKSRRVPAAKKDSKTTRKNVPFRVIEGNKGKTKTNESDNDSNMYR
jgi:hypothetical protein